MATVLQGPASSSATRSALAVIRQVLAEHEPFPAFVIDGHWNVIERNEGAELFAAGVAPFLLQPPVNVLRLALHPHGMAPRIVNLDEWGADEMRRLRRKLATHDDPWLAALHDELSAYRGGAVRHEDEPSGPDRFVPLRLRDGDRDLTLLSVVTELGTRHDVAGGELALKAFVPGDAATAAALRARRPAPVADGA
jgi:MmyB-like transcription regulator ligand binding domain